MATWGIMAPNGADGMGGQRGDGRHEDPEESVVAATREHQTARAVVAAESPLRVLRETTDMAAAPRVIVVPAPPQLLPSRSRRRSGQERSSSPARTVQVAVPRPLCPALARLAAQNPCIMRAKALFIHGNRVIGKLAAGDRCPPPEICSIGSVGCKCTWGKAMAARGKQTGGKTKRRSGSTPSTQGRKRCRAERDDGELIKRDDVAAFVDAQATRIAAPDVHALVADAGVLRDKAAAVEGERFEVFRRQVDDALTCLEDHAAGRCPQIPYYTIAVLAAALFYFHSTVDAVPDFLPRLGVVDDALVMAVATELAADGLRRYQTWKTTAG